MRHTGCHYPLPGALVAAAVVLLAACTPTLNWRVVQLDAWSALLPCKPDRGERVVQLAGQDLKMHMAGCEAGGALFAISQVQVDSPTAVAGTLQAWRAAALGNMQSTQTHETPMTLATPGSAVRTVVHVQGRGPDGKPVQAQLLWITAGTGLFHAAVYAPRLSPDMTEPFFSELHTP